MKKNNRFLKNLTTEKKMLYFFYLVFFISIAIYFLPFTLQGLTLDGDDAKYPYEDLFLNFENYLGNWSDAHLLGSGGKNIIQPSALIYNFFPASLATSLIYIIPLFFIFSGSYWFFRNLSFSVIPGIFSSWIISFSPVYFTYIRTGHIGKIFTVGFFFYSFATTLKIFKVGFSWKLILLNACFLSLGFVSGATQTYLYLAIVYIAFILYLFLENIIRRSKQSSFLKKTTETIKSKKKTIFALMLSGIFAFFLSFEVIEVNFSTLTGRKISSTDSLEKYITPLPPKQSSQEVSQAPQTTPETKWNWATQWSLPKLETIDFFIPGIFGFLSNDPTHPYWGKVGQTPGWEEHRQGYRNYSLAVNYLGIIFVFFLIYGLLKMPLAPRIFWGIISLALLLLSYGRFFFVYEWVYQLPYMDKLRNPNKFILVLYLSLSLIAAYGINIYYQNLKEKIRSEKFFLTLGSIAVASLVIVLIVISVQKTNLTLHFANFYSSGEAKTIVSNIQSYLLRGVVVFTLAGFLLAYLPIVSQKLLPYFVAGIILFAFIDTYQVNKKFLKTVPIPSQTTNDPITQFLVQEKVQQPFRVKVLQRGNYLNYFLWNLARRYHIDTIDFLTARNGLSPDLTLYFTKLTQNFKFLKLANTLFILSQQIVNHPELEYVTQAEYPGINEKIFIYRLRNTLPRIYLRGKVAQAETPEKLVELINQPNFDIDRTVAIHSSIVNNPQYQINSIEETPQDSIKLTMFQPKKYQVDLNLSSPKILVLANKYNSKWNGYDQKGRPLEQIPVNYLFNGFLVKPGMTQVTLIFENTSRENFFNFLTSLNYILLILLLAFWIFKQYGNKSKNKIKKK